MKLSIKDRIVVSNVLPVQGDYMTLKLRKDLLGKIELSQEEFKLVGMEISEEGNAKWDEKKDPNKDIEITELESKLIVKSLKELEEKKELNTDTMDIYEKFVN